MEPFWTQIDQLFKTEPVSDLFLTPGRLVLYKTRGETRQGSFPVSNEAFDHMEKALPTQLGPCGSVDGQYNHAGRRFRVNLCRAKGGKTATLRPLPLVIPHPVSIRVPDKVLTTLSEMRAGDGGIVLVCGPNGSGKSTTCASIIGWHMKEHDHRLITIEDPIEYPLSEQPEYGFRVLSRDVGSDVASFHAGLKDALRQGPDVLLVGEIRDYETAKVALDAANTGHLVFATFHTNSAATTCDRFTGLFPREGVNSATITLAETIRLIICQRLVPNIEGNGRVAIHEVMLPTPAVKTLIRASNFSGITNEIDVGSKVGHLSFERSRSQAVAARLISAVSK